jgi:hypothetical protein
LNWFWKWLSWLVQWIQSVVSFKPQRQRTKTLKRKPQRFAYARVDEFPDSLKSATVYVSGERGHAWAAALICPCGCGEVIELNLLKQVRPCWDIEEHQDGSVSLMPSVWRQKGCGSHFFVRRGRIDWCLDTVRTW